VKVPGFADNLIFDETWFNYFVPKMSNAQIALAQDAIDAARTASKAVSSSVDKKVGPEDTDKVPSSQANWAMANVSKMSSSLAAMARIRALEGNRGVRLKPIKGQVLQAYLFTSGAGSALSVVQKLTPQTATEFSAYLSLYDECKVDSVTAIFQCYANGAALPEQIEFGLAFDPINNGTYSTASGVLLASQHKFVCGSVGDGATNMAIPKSMNSDGFFKWRIKIPKGATALSNATDGPTYVGGQWFETGDSDSNANCGYLKIFSPAYGSISTNVNMHLIFHCSFRSRT